MVRPGRHFPEAPERLLREHGRRLVSVFPRLPALRRDAQDAGRNAESAGRNLGRIHADAERRARPQTHGSLRNEHRGAGLDTQKVGTVAAPSGGTVNMHTIEGQVAVITGAAGGIGQALALDMVRRGAAGMALVDLSDRVVQVAREINNEAGRQVVIAYRGNTTDTAFRQEVYADVTAKAGVPRICVPAAAITKDALSGADCGGIAW